MLDLRVHRARVDRILVRDLLAYLEHPHVVGPVAGGLDRLAPHAQGRDRRRGHDLDLGERSRLDRVARIGDDGLDPERTSAALDEREHARHHRVEAFTVDRRSNRRPDRHASRQALRQFRLHTEPRVCLDLEHGLARHDWRTWTDEPVGDDSLVRGSKLSVGGQRAHGARVGARRGRLIAHGLRLVRRR